MFTFVLTRLFCRYSKIKSHNSVKDQNLFLDGAGHGYWGKGRSHWDKFVAFFGLNLIRCISLLPVVKAEHRTEQHPRARYNFIADVVEDVAAAVVCIEVKGLRLLNQIPPNGSGFLVKNDGLILTNAHVVTNRLGKTVLIKLHDGRTFPGVVEDVDLRSDLATVRIQAENLPVMKLGSSSNVRPGEWVVAIGSPLSLSNTITSGVISSTCRRSSEIGINNDGMEYLQTDASITFGNSGGPLVNLDGEVIGINCIKIAGGISFAIPIDYAKVFLKRMEEKHRKRSRLSSLRYTGMTTYNMTPDMLKRMELGEEIKSALLVTKVEWGSPAHTSGLKRGDVVTHINSSSVSDINATCEALESGKPLNMTVIRNGSHREIFIVPEHLKNTL
ncbi:hypothetical protein RUM44_010220 [Polyplax serrata]|uniref:Serine protease HTRA2, mitochondrial n=1 Tax=Polyplax serrata TaxID=468196 RepID=A0ABR1AVK6_POLSC